MYCTAAYILYLRVISDIQREAKHMRRFGGGDENIIRKCGVQLRVQAATHIWRSVADVDGGVASIAALSWQKRRYHTTPLAHPDGEQARRTHRTFRVGGVSKKIGPFSAAFEPFIFWSCHSGQFCINYT